MLNTLENKSQGEISQLNYFHTRWMNETNTENAQVGIQDFFPLFRVRAPYHRKAGVYLSDCKCKTLKYHLYWLRIQIPDYTSVLKDKFQPEVWKNKTKQHNQPFLMVGSFYPTCKYKQKLFYVEVCPPILQTVSIFLYCSLMCSSQEHS